MALFNRRSKGGNNLPTEVQEYYQAEHRDRTGVAWLLALGTLIVTILLALGLFFGGRWVYRQVANNDEAETTTRNGQETQSPQASKDQTAQPDTKTPQPSTPPAQPAPTPSTNTPSTARPNTQPNTGDSTSLPSTGPAEIVQAFLITTVVATILYQIRLRSSVEK